MKPRNKFEKAVLAESKHLRPITKTQSKWAFRECIDHFAYRMPKGRKGRLFYFVHFASVIISLAFTCPKCSLSTSI